MHTFLHRRTTLHCYASRINISVDTGVFNHTASARHRRATCIDDTRVKDRNLVYYDKKRLSSLRRVSVGPREAILPLINGDNISPSKILVDSV